MSMMTQPFHDEIERLEKENKKLRGEMEPLVSALFCLEDEGCQTKGNCGQPMNCFACIAEKALIKSGHLGESK